MLIFFVYTINTISNFGSTKTLKKKIVFVKLILLLYFPLLRCSVTKARNARPVTRRGEPTSAA